MKRKALSVLSLAMKAGKVLSGTDQVLDGLSEGVVSLVILSEDVELPEDIVKQAEMKDVNVLKSPVPSYETAVKLYELLK